MKRNKSLLVLLCLSALSMSCSTARLETNNHYYYTTEYIQEKDPPPEKKNNEIETTNNGEINKKTLIPQKTQLLVLCKPTLIKPIKLKPIQEYAKINYKNASEAMHELGRYIAELRLAIRKQNDVVNDTQCRTYKVVVE